MNSPIAQFQQSFVAALYGDDAQPLSAQPGFQVYRNTVIKGCIDALQANFPAVVRLVGEEWFRAAASVHVRATPPSDASLLRYGATFPQFLQDFAPAAQLPYLRGVAQLDQAWLQAHTAADAAALDADRLVRLPLERFAALRLAPHPAARWFWFDGMPVHTIWNATRRDAALPDPLPWRSEGTLLTRPHDEVQWMHLGRAGFLLLESVRQGLPLHVALDAAAREEDDIAGWLPDLLRSGAFTDITPDGAHADEPITH